ncbi:uncharacterized protein KGF55_003583 [Candida pseudojiufengensis]|uniref:uncharacterized protein n=1 Tax=Candida pseudojiufengensis TaxID=497109 RepID=UPI0022252B61|nr:uncharacterized protein KGF55_003583 [Candida pseudojiufengensis]KAI5962507.1 hypothetical protein KGF55_003583 [Candida pseudojiufengensis]
MSRLNHLKSIPNYAVTFIGQGIVKNGLLESNKKYLPIFQKYLDEIDDALNEEFSKHLFYKDTQPRKIKDWFNKTSNAQPAILASSYIITKIFEEVYDVDLIKNAKYLLGHSLGEYTALTLSGILDLKTSIQLVRKRGELMEDMFRYGSEAFGMIALIIRPEYVEDVIDLATKDHILANINAPTQIVVSGEMIKTEEFIINLRKLNKRILMKEVKLPVSVPFHNEILKYMVPKLKKFLETKSIGEQKIPIISNLDGEISTDSKQTIKKLLEANYQPVQWMKSIQNLPVDEIYNIGPSHTLYTLNKRYDNIKNNVLIENIENFVNSES